MSMIPDARRDKYYNQKYLNEKDVEFIKGYDWALEVVLGYFDNMDDYSEKFELDEEYINLASFLSKPKHEPVLSVLKDTIEHWHECNRDEMITSMIDSMGEDEYEQMKQDVDSGRRKPCFREESDVQNALDAQDAPDNQATSEKKGDES